MAKQFEARPMAGAVAYDGPEEEIWLALSDLVVRVDQVQARVKKIDENHVLAMQISLNKGEEFKKAIVVARLTDVDLGDQYLVLDGHHRVKASLAVGRERIRAEIVECTLAEGLTVAEESNFENSLALTYDDKFNIYKRRWEREYVFPDGQTWMAVSAGIHAEVLGVKSSTVSDWFKRLPLSLQEKRLSKVIGRDGRLISTEKIKETGPQKAARERLALKVKLATKNGKLTERDHNYLIEEVSDDPRDLRLYITRPGQGRVEINGRYEIPSKVYADQQRAIKEAEQRVNDNPPSERVEPNHVIVLKDGDWQPETLKAMRPLEHVTVGEEQPSAFNPAAIETYTNTHYRYNRFQNAIEKLENAVAEMEESLKEVKPMRSIRSINEMGGGWRDGTKGLLAAALESIERVGDHKEAILQLLEQLEGEDG